MGAKPVLDPADSEEHALVIDNTKDTVDRLAGAETFLRELHDALAHLRDLPIYSAHPLGALLGHTSPVPPAALRQLLLDAIEQLRPPAHVTPVAPRWRRYRYLRLRYVEGVPLPQVSAMIGIGERQARREHRAALQELAALLLDPSARSAEPTEPETFGGGLSSPVAFGRGEALPEANDGAELDVELSQLDDESSLEPIDPWSAVDDALRLVERLAAGHAVELRRLPGSEPLDRAPGEPLAVLARRTILRQVLLNLLTYLIGLPSTRLIQVTVNAAGVRAEIRLWASGAVSDDANGPSPALVAAKRLAEGEQGAVRIERNQEGVIVRLLLLTSRACLVLVVDDNPDLLRLFRRYLRGEGFCLVQARNAIRALQLVRTLRPDVIVLDLMMPVQDGWDFFHAVRSDPTTADIPIVACSVLPERELALSLQVSDFLAKPVTPESLRRALAPYRRPLRSDPDHHPGAAVRRGSP